MLPGLPDVQCTLCKAKLKSIFDIRVCTVCSHTIGSKNPEEVLATTALVILLRLPAGILLLLPILPFCVAVIFMQGEYASSFLLGHLDSSDYQPSSILIAPLLLFFLWTFSLSTCICFPWPSVTTVELYIFPWVLYHLEAVGLWFSVATTEQSAFPIETWRCLMVFGAVQTSLYHIRV